MVVGPPQSQGHPVGPEEGPGEGPVILETHMSSLTEELMADYVLQQQERPQKLQESLEW